MLDEEHFVLIGFDADYRGMVVRGAVFSVVYGLFLVMGVYHVAAFF